MFAYVGGYTTPDRDGTADGINVYRIDRPGRAWTHIQNVPCHDNPSFLRIGPDGRTLFAVHGGRSSVSAFAIDAESGRLNFINREDSGGANPVDLGFDCSGRLMVVPHYTSGTIGVLPVAADGRLGPLAQTIPLTGTPGPRQADQPGPLPHGVTPDPTGRFLVIPDKGLDRLFVFTFSDGRLVPAPAPSAPALPGSGPRHAAFHPHLPMLYAVNELDCTVRAYRWDAATGALDPVQSLSALPEGTTTPSWAAEIAVSASGTCVYSSNRGHDSIARFSVDPATGMLRFEDCTSTLGREPRLFALDPAGRHLHVGNQATHTIVTFDLDAADGRLSGGGIAVETGSPTAICFGAA